MSHSKAQEKIDRLSVECTYGLNTIEESRGIKTDLISNLDSAMIMYTRI